MKLSEKQSQNAEEDQKDEQTTEEEDEQPAEEDKNDEDEELAELPVEYGVLETLTTTPTSPAGGVGYGFHQGRMSKQR